ncbi:signal peptidase I [Paenibacillus apiarius]|uniref:Signal peptidase I n=1 Tax=Paenibacillus apiarius TaxID=46240 RepID=A0ABT4DLV8_9BACL|nr:signal peptidase I [Paenibacillus apiarius]MCY9518033.1 signal peptidase I [Paenibacillus apiarius]MCY9518346.1 signal peptidase I [Paenibacillus apiarius]MCY9551253.1 signal peptidase I [Paenibacillus apiarius]MCY9558407.1 signal peptidase I [Paenibacillus apiarius]MCY9684807.1 signal peptidase I [Paenibacillus apiarius]
MDQNDQMMQPNAPEEPKEKMVRSKSELLEWIKAIAIAVILVVIVRWLLFAPFIVDGPSMEPNFWTGERLIVNKILYEFREPERGEVVVFHVPQENRDLIKRVIGVAGDTIEYRGDDLFVNGEKVEEPYIQGALDQAHKNGELYNDRDFPNEQKNKVPEGQIFVMGDHRNNSTDSRMLGFIPLSDVIGRADIIFWPISHAKLIKHH